MVLRLIVAEVLSFESSAIHKSLLLNGQRLWKTTQVLSKVNANYTVRNLLWCNSFITYLQNDIIIQVCMCECTLSSSDFTH